MSGAKGERFSPHTDPERSEGECILKRNSPPPLPLPLRYKGEGKVSGKRVLRHADDRRKEESRFLRFLTLTGLEMT